MITVIGAGLAGCEAALQCRRFGLPVRLFEMRPVVMTPAHRTGDPAELVCSNSLKSEEHTNAHGLLKAELKIYRSFLLECAECARIPGGKALVVDRKRFSAAVEAELKKAGVEIVRAEVNAPPDTPCIIATGPLTSPALSNYLLEFLGARQLFFYDAIAPIVSGDSLNMEKLFSASRYGKGNDYLNAPLTEEEYNRLVEALTTAELYPAHQFDTLPPAGADAGAQLPFFSGCLPIEELARRDRLALAFGPLKPVGLLDPRTGRMPFAVVQLRKENAAGTMFNLVGFQTRLKRPEQERVLRLIPGLERAEFLRYGSIHRNTFLNSPEILLPTLATRKRADLLIAGQLTGVEGYVESIATGLLAGINISRLVLGKPPLVPPGNTILGALVRYITTPNPCFQPMNANFGLLPPSKRRARGLARRRLFAERALDAARRFGRQFCPEADLPGAHFD